MVTYSAEKAIRFIKDITYHFDTMNHIITNLGPMFTGDALWDYYEKAGSEVCYASVAHPRANRQVED